MIFFAYILEIVNEHQTLVMSSRLCGTCEQVINGDEYAICEGICSRSFHGTIKCSTVRSDIVRLTRRGGNLKFVCNECQNVSLLHVMRTLKICNDHVLSLHEKIEDMAAASSNIFRRISTLETSVNDVTDMESSRLSDVTGPPTNRLSRNFLLALNVMESRLKSFVSERLLERDPRVSGDQSCQTELCGSTVVTMSQACQTSDDADEIEVVSLDSSVVVDESEDDLGDIDSDSYSADMSDNEDDDRCSDEGALVFTNTLLRLRRHHDFASFHLQRASSMRSRKRRVRFDVSSDEEHPPIVTSDVQIQRTPVTGVPNGSDSGRRIRATALAHGDVSRCGHVRSEGCTGNPMSPKISLSMPLDRTQQRLLMLAAESNPVYGLVEGGTVRRDLKWIRVAGLRNDVTEHQIVVHVKEAIGCEDVRCTPLFKRNVDPSSLPWLSYKVGVPARHFAAVMSKDIWPDDVTTREFVQNFRRDRPRSRDRP